MSKQHIININGATQGLSESVSPTRGSGQRIRLVEPAALDLVDADTGMGPTQVQVKRVGSALNIALDGNSVDTPDFVVENFFEKEGSTLMGQAQPGEYYDYITTESEGNKMGMVAQMWDGSSSPLIFGEASPPTAFVLAPPASPYLFLGALTVGALTSSKAPSSPSITVVAPPCHTYNAGSYHPY